MQIQVFAPKSLVESGEVEGMVEAVKSALLNECPDGTVIVGDIMEITARVNSEESHANNTAVYLTLMHGGDILNDEKIQAAFNEVTAGYPGYSLVCNAVEATAWSANGKAI